MIELTKANIDVGQVGEWEDPNTWQCTMQFFESKEEAEKVKQQLLDDYDKARKYDELALDEEDKDITLHGAKLIKQNQKLRERIEKRIEEWNTNEEPELCQCDDCSEIKPYDVELFEKLLEDKK